MFTQSEIQEVATLNPTSKIVIKEFSERQRFRRNTNLSKLQNDLLAKGEKVVEDEYIATFTRLEELGAGTLIIGRRGKPNRFKWNYNLKDIAKSASGSLPVNEIEKFEKKGPGRPANVIKKGPGRPKGSVNKKVMASHGPISITINISPDELLRLIQQAS